MGQLKGKCTKGTRENEQWMSLQHVLCGTSWTTLPQLLLQSLLGWRACAQEGVNCKDISVL